MYSNAVAPSDNYGMLGELGLIVNAEGRQSFFKTIVSAAE